MNIKVHPSLPYLLLSLVLLAGALGNWFRPDLFFPALPGAWILAVGLAAAAFAVRVAWRRRQAAVAARRRAVGLVDQVTEWRRPLANPEEKDVAGAGRTISRLVANVDEDLREIKPDLTLGSLERLERILPTLLLEAVDEQEARIRLGVVGTYLGETLCRHRGWHWHFRTDPSLRQFHYLASALRKGQLELDPYEAACRMLTGRLKAGDLLKGLD